MDKKSELKAAFHALISEAGRQLGEAPTVEQLQAYHRGELPPEEQERIRIFLAHHPEAAQRFLDLIAYPGDPEDPDYLSDEALEGDWEKLQRRLHIDEELDQELDEAASVIPFSQHQRSEREEREGTRKLRRSTWVPAVAAATACIFVGGSSIWTLRNQVEELSETVRMQSEPRISVQRQALLQNDPRGAESATGPPIELPPGADEYFLVLTLIEERTFPDYRLEILQRNLAEGEPLWSRDGLLRRGDDTFELLLPREYLSPGEYLLRLYGLGPGEPEPLAEYGIKL